MIWMTEAGVWDVEALKVLSERFRTFQLPRSSGLLGLEAEMEYRRGLLPPRHPVPDLIRARISGNT